LLSVRVKLIIRQPRLTEKATFQIEISNVMVGGEFCPSTICRLGKTPCNPQQMSPHSTVVVCNSQDGHTSCYCWWWRKQWRHGRAQCGR